MYVIKVDLGIGIRGIAYLKSNNIFIKDIKYAKIFQRKSETEEYCKLLNARGFSVLVEVYGINYKESENSEYIEAISEESKKVGKEELINHMLSKFNKILYNQPKGLSVYRLKLEGYYPSFTWSIIEDVYKKAGWRRACVNVNNSCETYLTLYANE